MGERIRKLIPAESGWRAVYATKNEQGMVSLQLRPLAAWVLCPMGDEADYDEGEQEEELVGMAQMDLGYMWTCKQINFLGYAAPEEDVLAGGWLETAAEHFKYMEKKKG